MYVDGMTADFFAAVLVYCYLVITFCRSDIIFTLDIFSAFAPTTVTGSCANFTTLFEVGEDSTDFS